MTKHKVSDETILTNYSASFPYQVVMLVGADDMYAGIAEVEIKSIDPELAKAIASAVKREVNKFGKTKKTK